MEMHSETYDQLSEGFGTTAQHIPESREDSIYVE